MDNPTVTVIQQLRKNSIQTNRDSADVLRHIIKNVSSRLVDTIQSLCLLWIDEVKAKDKTYIWVSVWWKTTN